MTEFLNFKIIYMLVVFACAFLLLASLYFGLTNKLKEHEKKKIN